MPWIWRRSGAARDPAALAGEGTGVVLVTHHLGDILPEIKRVILMSGGRIVGDGPQAELLTEARLSRLFSAPVRIGAKRSGCTAGNGRAGRRKRVLFRSKRTESGNETKVTKMRLDALGPWTNLAIHGKGGRSN